MAEVTIVASPEALPKFPYEERAARHALGLTEDEMRAMRKLHLTGSVDFILHKKRLFLSDTGLDRLFAAAGQPLPKKAAAAQRGLDPGDVEGPEKKAATPTTLVVVRTDLANPHMLLACAPDDDPDRPKKPLRVRVRETRNFVRRMEIPAWLVPGYDDLFELARATPRQKGKW